jgi:hypothetical protein
VTFFDTRKGLFSAGREGEHRWSLVREVGIVASVYPVPVLPFQNIYVFFSSIRIPPSQTIKLSCILQNAATPDPHDKTLRSQAGSEFPHVEQIDHLRKLLVHDSLLELRVSDRAAEHGDLFLYHRNQPARKGHFLLRVVHGSWPWNRTMSQAQGIISEVHCMRNIFGRAKVVRLENFPKTLLDDIKHLLQSDTERAPDRRLITWVSTWKDEDGKEVEAISPVCPAPPPFINQAMRQSRSDPSYFFQSHRIWSMTRPGEPISPLRMHSPTWKKPSQSTLLLADSLRHVVALTPEHARQIFVLGHPSSLLQP